MKTLQSRQRMVSASAVCAAALVLGVVAIAGQDDPLVKTEPLATVIKRTQGREADVRQAPTGSARRVQQHRISNPDESVHP